MASRRAPMDGLSGAGDAGDPFPPLSSRLQSREVTGPPSEAQRQGPAPRMGAPGQTCGASGFMATQPPQSDAVQSFPNTAPCPSGRAASTLATGRSEALTTVAKGGRPLGSSHDG